MHYFIDVASNVSSLCVTFVVLAGRERLSFGCHYDRLPFGVTKKCYHRCHNKGLYFPPLYKKRTMKTVLSTEISLFS